jgi:hypothetical protein
MRLLAGEAAAIRLQQGLACEGPAHGAFIAVPFEHALFQNRGQKAGHNGVFSGGLKAYPASDVFLQGDGNVAQPRLHDTSIVPLFPCQLLPSLEK